MYVKFSSFIFQVFLNIILGKYIWIKKYKFDEKIQNKLIW
jgi:hypothetical protein